MQHLNTFAGTGKYASNGVSDSMDATFNESENIGGNSLSVVTNNELNPEEMMVRKVSFASFEQLVQEDGSTVSGIRYVIRNCHF